MLVRLAMPEEVEDIIRLGRANVEETLPGEPFETAIVRETFQNYLDTANPTFFVVEQQRRVIGFLQATINSYDYRSGLYVCQRVLYVSPENRGSRAAVSLTRHLIDWANQLGAQEIIGGNDNGFNSERTAAFLEHFGFVKVGYAMTKRLKESQHGWQERRQKRAA